VVAGPCRVVISHRGQPSLHSAILYYAAVKNKLFQFGEAMRRRGVASRAQCRRWCRRHWRVVVLLSLITAEALALRLIGSAYALPTVSYEEGAILERVWAMAATGDLNPHWFRFPGFQLYIYLGILKVMSFFGEADWASFVLACRGFQAFVGALTVPLVYLIGVRVYGRPAGLVAAFFLAIFPAHILYSHVATPDVFFTFLVMVVLLLSLDLLRHMQRRYYLAAGIVSGLAIATNYHGVFLILAPVAAHFFYMNTYHEESVPVLAKDLFIMTGAAAGAFLLAAPFSLLDVATFWADTASLTMLVTPGMIEALSGYGRVVDNDIGAVLFLLLLGGLVYAAYRHTRYDTLSLMFCVLGGLFLLGWDEPDVRFTIPLVSYMVVMASALVVAALRRLAAVAGKRRRLIGIAAAVIILVWSLLVPLRIITQQSRVLLGHSISTVALAWAQDNIPAGSRIYREPDIAGLQYLQDEMGNPRFIVNSGRELPYEYGDYESFYGGDYEYVLCNDYCKIALADANAYPAQHLFYSRLYADYSIVGVFVSDRVSYGAAVIEDIHYASGILILQRHARR